MFFAGNGYNDFIINYVFETPDQLNDLTERLRKLNLKVYSFRLTCSKTEQERRIKERQTGQVDWELNRFVELNNILDTASSTGFIGQKILTDCKDISAVTDDILSRIKKNNSKS